VGVVIWEAESRTVDVDVGESLAQFDDRNMPRDGGGCSPNRDTDGVWYSRSPWWAVRWGTVLVMCDDDVRALVYRFSKKAAVLATQPVGIGFFRVCTYPASAITSAMKVPAHDVVSWPPYRDPRAARSI
jgi:hypothetical protein